MAKKISKRTLKWIVAAVAVAVVAFIGFRYWKSEADRAARGDRVGQRPASREARRRRRQGAAAGQGDPRRRGRPGQAGSGAGAAGHRHAGGGAGRGQGERRRRAGAAGGRQGLHRQAEERDRAGRDRGSSARSKLVAEGAGSQRELRRPHDEAGDDQGHARARRRRCCRPPSSRSRSREANAATIQTRIDDATLKSPVTGRVLYRLAEAGRGPRRRRQGADAGEPGGRLHGDLPALGGGGRA